MVDACGVHSNSPDLGEPLVNTSDPSEVECNCIENVKAFVKLSEEAVSTVREIKLTVPIGNAMRAYVQCFIL